MSSKLVPVDANTNGNDDGKNNRQKSDEGKDEFSDSPPTPLPMNQTIQSLSEAVSMTKVAEGKETQKQEGDDCEQNHDLQKQCSPAGKDSQHPQSTTKKKGGRRKKAAGMPKRPLSAYNLFFREERAKIMAQADDVPKDGGGSQEGDHEGQHSPPFSSSETPKPSKAGRVGQYIPHGKVGFESLAKAVAAKWNVLTEDKKAIYRRMAAVEMARYRDEVRKWQASQVTSPRDEDHSPDEVMAVEQLSLHEPPSHPPGSQAHQQQSMISSRREVASDLPNGLEGASSPSLHRPDETDHDKSVFAKESDPSASTMIVMDHSNRHLVDEPEAPPDHTALGNTVNGSSNDDSDRHLLQHQHQQLQLIEQDEGQCPPDNRYPNWHNLPTPPAQCRSLAAVTTADRRNLATNQPQQQVHIITVQQDEQMHTGRHMYHSHNSHAPRGWSSSPKDILLLRRKQRKQRKHVLLQRIKRLRRAVAQERALQRHFGSYAAEDGPGLW